MRNSDLQVLHEILETHGGFSHREHLELAWSYLRLYSIDEAAEVMVAAIRHVARLHGAASRELILSEAARASWTAPDLRRLPALV